MNPAWHLGFLALFDTETDSADPDDARIVTAAHILVHGRGEHDPRPRAWLLQPERDIPEAATRVHGVTTAHAQQHGMDRADGINLICGEVAVTLLAGHPIVGHNVVYDLTVLDRECARTGVPALEERLNGPVAPIIDTLVLDKQVCPRRRRVSETQGARQLVTLCQIYDVDLAAAHDAYADALAAGRVLYRIATRYPHIAAMRLDELHAAQVEWSAEQAASFQEWKRRSGDPDCVIDGSWPVRPRITEGVA